MEYPPVFEPGLYSLSGSPADQTVSSADHNQEGGSEGHPNVESHVTFTMAQGGMPHGAPHTSHKLISSPETPSRASQDQHISSAREYHLSQRNMEVSGGGGGGGVSSANPSALTCHHSLHIVVTAQTTTHTFHSSDSPQSIYVSAPASGSTSHHHNITTSSPSLSVTSHRQNLYVTTPVQLPIQQNISVSHSSSSSTSQKFSSTGGAGRLVSQYTFGHPGQANSVQGLENQTSQSNKLQRSSRSLTPTKPFLPAPPDSSPSNKDTEDVHRESSA